MLPEKVVVQFEFEKTVEYDHPDHGAGFKADGTADDAHWGIDMSHLNTTLYGPTATIAVKLYVHLEKFGMNLTDFSIFKGSDDGTGRLTAMITEDNDGNEIDDAWFRRTGKQMFLCDYDIFMKLLPDDREPTAEEAKELFPNLEVE